MYRHPSGCPYYVYTSAVIVLFVLFVLTVKFYRILYPSYPYVVLLVPQRVDFLSANVDEIRGVFTMP